MAPLGGPTLNQSGQGFIEALLQSKFAAEDRGASEEVLARWQRRIDDASRALMPTGQATERARDPQDAAAKLMRTLNNISTKPKLGEASRVPTPQQVQQWIRDVDSGFQSVQATVDSSTRTYWALGTIQYSVHRELLQQKISDGVITSWVELYTEELRLVQDPLLTRYQNYASFWNFVWRNSDTVSGFLLQLSKKEALLKRSFFKTPEGNDDDELKISFVWARVPEAYQREMRRHALEAIQNWEDFERALRNAETVAKIDSDGAPAAPRGASGNGQNGGKRHSSQANNRHPGKKQDRKYSSSTPSRDQSPAHNVPPASGSNAEQRGNRPWHTSQGGGGNQNQGYQRNQKPHWKNKSNQKPHWENKGDQQNQPLADSAGKDKP
jgi:hypothetical protein